MELKSSQGLHPLHWEIPEFPPSFDRMALAMIVRISLLFLVLATLAWAYWELRMPSARGTAYPAPLSENELRTADVMRRDVEHLAGRIGVRNLYLGDSLERAAEYLEQRLTQGNYRVRRLPFAADGHTTWNIEAELPGASRPEEIVVIGAHYDTVPGTPGANDNASGLAALLVLADRFAGARPARTLRLVAFPNEEPDFFQTDTMGSLVYARACREQGDDVVAMLSLETIGYFSEMKGTQRYPLALLGWFYPSQGNFIGFVGNVRSRRLVRAISRQFGKDATVPFESAALPAGIPGVGWSDHWAFWQQGYRAAMVTDTALFRYAHYHLPEDTPDKLNYEMMARLMTGLEGVVRMLAEGDERY